MQKQAELSQPIKMFTDEYGPYGLSMLDIYERKAVFPLQMCTNRANSVIPMLMVYDATGDLIGSTVVNALAPDYDWEAAKQYYLDMCNFWVEEKGD
jgi:hypothetical protein